MGDKFASDVSKWGFNGPPKSQVPGMISSGNIDLARRPIVHHAGGDYGTVYSYTLDEKGNQVLVPGITQMGQTLPNEDAARTEYERTGQYLGKFRGGNSYAASDAYANLIHNKQMEYQSQQNHGEYNPTFNIWETGSRPITDSYQQQKFVQAIPNRFAYVKK
jgi:hypothetical protein